MSDPKWTPEQEQAITAGGTNILVAAAAGAGKTATLVERVIRRLAGPDPMDVDELLVVTFTEAAATEMRERIGQALQKALAEKPEDARLQRQLALLGRAAISTLHSFCLGLLRQYFYRLGLDPALQVMNEHEALLLRREVLDDLFSRRFDAEGEQEGPFYALVDRYGGGRDDEGLKQLVLQLYDYAQSLPWPDLWLEQAADRFDVPSGTPLEQTIWWAPLAARVRLDLTQAAAALAEAGRAARLPFGPTAYSDTLTLEEAAVRVAAEREGTWEQVRAAVHAIIFGRLPPAKKDEVDEDLKDWVQTLRNQAKDTVKSLREMYFERTANEWLHDLHRAAPHMRTLIGVVREFSEEFCKAKAEQGSVDFNDLERFALKLLVDEQAPAGDLQPSDVAKELRKRYKEVLVDEYQDINGVQDAILMLVASAENPNRFMVGDVKQSIYRFRHADPSLFLAKYVAYAPWREARPDARPAEPPQAAPRAMAAALGDGLPEAAATAEAPPEVRAARPEARPQARSEGARIVLGANFRSRPGVVDGINFLFRQVLTPRVGELSYDKDAELVCRAAYPPIPGRPEGTDYPVEFHVLDRVTPAPPAPTETTDPTETAEAGENEAEPSPEALDLAEMSAMEREARLVTRRIKELVGGAPGQAPQQVWDHHLGAYRNARYRDVVILLRATTGRADIFLEAMSQAGIPAYAQLTTGYFAATEVAVILSLLQVLDNPRQDIPLAAVLRSPIVGLSSADLARIRLANQGTFYDAAVVAMRQDLFPALTRFWRSLEEWRTAARQSPLSQVIWRIYQETGYLRYVGGMPGGVQRHANLLALYDRARQFDQFARQGLFRFLRFIDRLKESDTDLGAAPALGEGEDVVRVMSIHKSKGLEFPVVFVAALGKQFGDQDQRGDLLLQHRLGFGPQLIDPDLRVKFPTLAWHAVKESIRMEALAEEMRVLYVALTRARERLILVGSATKGLPDSLARWSAGTAAAGWPLPDATLASARSYLDWIAPVLARHGGAGALRGSAGERSLDPAVATDPSRWEVHLWDATAQQELLQPEATAVADRVDWNRIRNLEPLDRPAESDAGAQLQDRFAWQYRYSPLVRHFAKLTVTELKGHFDPNADQPLPDLPGLPGLPEMPEPLGQPSEGGATVPPQRHSAAEAAGEQGGTVPRRLDRRPRFLQETRKALTPTEFGTLMHLVLQHLDLTRPLDEAGVRAQVHELLERDLIAPAQAEAADAAMVAGFFATPLGQRIQQRPERVRREVSFTLGLPAVEVYPDLPKAVAEGETVVVQGMIDVLVELDDGFLLIDYKTDKRDPEEAARAYYGQIRIYRRAVEEILGKPVREAYLHFLMENRPVRIE
ncbi:MAG TPA: UvrD-helicase domain-containing protein [Symbiobacteriaceae bacterium]|jgi:ATP-dependent helicase/nuclease subunit A